MDERVCFISDWLTDGLSVSELCRRYEISRKTGHKWLSRYRKEGASGLSERSRAPKSNPRSVSMDVRALLIAERKARPHWGARKIVARLKEQHPDVSWPSDSTAHEVLYRAGLVKERRRRRKLGTESKLLAPDVPNAVWAADFKGEFRLGNRELCYPLTISDSFSRYLLGCRSLREVPHTFREY